MKRYPRQPTCQPGHRVLSASSHTRPDRPHGSRDECSSAGSPLAEPSRTIDVRTLHTVPKPEDMAQPRHLTTPAYLVAFALICIPPFDTLMQVLPLRLDQPRWRFGAFGLMSNTLMLTVTG